MVDFNQKAAPTSPERFPLEDALEPLKKQSHIDLGADAPLIERTWAAFSGDRDRLDLGDVFFALAHPSLYSDVAEIKSRLLEILGYREEDPLQFKTLALGPNQQLALTIIEPAHRDLAEPTLIFVTGFAHPAPLYVDSMQKLAKALHTKVVVIDLPGNGASQSSSTVNQRDLYKALKLTITSEVAEGAQYYVSGHSLGSSPTYQLFQDIKSGKAPVGNRELVRMVIINPIPTRLQETSGGASISRPFMLGGVLSQVAHGFQGMRANSLHLFNNETPDTVTEKTNPLVAREDVPISTLGLLTSFGALDLDDPIDSVGSDKRLAIILTKKDKLMKWNVDTYENRRGYHIMDGDHGACLIGPQISAMCTKHLVSAFRGDPNDSVPRATPETVYRHGSGTVRLGLGWRSDNAAVASPEIVVKHGLLTFGSAAGVYLGGGIVSEVGYKFGSGEHGIATPQAQLYLGTEGLRLPLDMKVGVRGGVDFITHAHPVTYGLMTSLGTNLARIIDVELQGRFTLSGQFQDIIAGFALRFL